MAQFGFCCRCATTLDRLGYATVPSFCVGAAGPDSSGGLLVRHQHVPDSLRGSRQAPLTSLLLCACAILTCSFGRLTGGRPATVCFAHVAVQMGAICTPSCAQYAVAGLLPVS